MCVNLVEVNSICNCCTASKLHFANSNKEDVDNNFDSSNNNTYVINPTTAENIHLQCFASKGLHFIHVKARSLLPKIPELSIIAQKTKASIISITESWLDSSITD